MSSLDREKLARALHAKLKRRRVTASLGRKWVNYDPSLNGSFAAEGRIYSSPEHYGQALCFGFKAKTTQILKFLLVLSTSTALWLRTMSGLYSVFLIVPLLLFYRLLGDRARLRKGAWDAIESLMQRDGATLMSAVRDNEQARA